MQIAMTEPEQQALAGLLRCTRRYLEFGSGGSTVLAAGLVRDWIIAVDSSREWLERVAGACPAQRSAQIGLHHVDIGPVGDWGMPLDANARPRWADYHGGVWQDARAEHAELVLVDGRFRVACFLQAVLRTAPGTLLAIHDYPQRQAYHAVEEFARPVLAVGSLVAMLRRPDYDPRRAAQVLERHWQEPN